MLVISRPARQQPDQGRLGALQPRVSKVRLLPKPGGYGVTGEARLPGRSDSGQQSLLFTPPRPGTGQRGAVSRLQGVANCLTKSFRCPGRPHNSLGRPVKASVTPDLASAKGFGDADPIASNATPQGPAQNRRVELSVPASGC